MNPVQLIHWNESEADERIEKLRAGGYAAQYNVLNPALLNAWRQQPPTAFVIDLSRLPSHGRDVALAIRVAKPTRHVPLIFVGGEPAKVQRIKQQLPDATYTSWRRIRSALKRALARSLADPVVPPTQLAGYSQTPLLKKLGIKAESVVVLVHAPEGFECTLGELPANVKVRRQTRGRRDLTIWFVRSLKELERRIDRFAEQVGSGGLWIAWPKQASGMKTEVTQKMVRKLGLASGLVDYKICAIDETWSGLKFATRKSE